MQAQIQDTSALPVSAPAVIRKEEPSFVERRRHTRHDCYWPATCRTDAGENLPAIVVDVSTGGMRIESRLIVSKLDTVWVELPDIGLFECTVRWVGSTGFGVEFSHEVGQLSEDELEAAAGALDRISI